MFVQKNHVRLALIVFTGVLVSMQPGWAQEATLQSFIGMTSGTPSELFKQMGVGWVRNDVFNWPIVEPRPGQWNWSRSDAMARGSSEGFGVLVMLSYTPGWAATQPSIGPSSTPKSSSDWQQYVEQTVSRYSSPPYNLRYFQIWNEPTIQAGWWRGTDQQYADLVYLPAAKIIRAHHCYVVFGGWPSNGTLQRFNALMNYHDLWRWTDIVDTHYRPFDDYQQLYKQWVATSKCRGIWQTEMGAVPPEHGGATSNLDSHFLYWTLQVGWRNPDEFKLFWYTGFGSGPDAEKSLAMPGPNGPEPTSQGKLLSALNEAIGGGALSIFTDFSSAVPPASGPNAVREPLLSKTTLGYRVGPKRVAIQFFLPRPYISAHESLPFRVRLPRKPSRAQLISAFGKTWDLPNQYAGGNAQVSVPLQTGFDDCHACAGVQGYLVLDE